MNLLGHLQKLTGLFGMVIMGALMIAIRYSTFGRGVNFNRMYIAPVGSRIVLSILGVRLKNLVDQTDEHVIYMFNHNSFLDIFLIPALGLRDTRFIISEATQKIFPLHMCNLGIDVLYIPTKEDPVRRAKFFERVTRELSSRKYKVITSPEGQHTFIHDLAPFNDGVFNMCVNSKTPIRCLFVDIPREANPLEGLEMKSCEVVIDSRELLDTSGWSPEDVSVKKEAVRELFLTHSRERYGDYGDSIITT